MPQCETTELDGRQCPNQASGMRPQCGECLQQRRPPANELVLTVETVSPIEARRVFEAKREQFLQEYPHCRLIMAGDDSEYYFTKSHKGKQATVVGNRQHWVRYMVQRAS